MISMKALPQFRLVRVLLSFKRPRQRQLLFGLKSRLC